MYTSKSFYEFFPVFLPSDVQVRVEEIVKLERQCAEERKEAVHSYYERHKEIIEESKDKNGDPNHLFIDVKLRKEKYPHEKVDAIYDKFKYFDLQKEKKDISNSFREAFVSENDVYKFKNATEAFTKYVENAMKIYAWAKASDKHKISLAKEGKTVLEAYESRFVSNYWHFMEWQSDLYPFGLMLFDLIPNKDDINFGDLTQKALVALNYTCGIQDFNEITKKELLDILWSRVENAMAWAYDNEDNWIIKNIYPETSQKDFEEHVDFLISLYAFFASLDLSDSSIPDLIYEESSKSRRYVKTDLALSLLRNNLNAKFNVNLTNELDVLPYQIEDVIYLLSQWINNEEKLDLPESMDYEENFENYKKKKQEAIYSLGVALAMLSATYPELKYFKESGRFYVVMDFVKSNGNSVFIEYKSFLSIFNALFDSLKSVLVYENPYSMSQIGQAVIANLYKFVALADFMRKNGLDIKCPNEYEPAENGKLLNLELVKGQIALIEEDEDDDSALYGWQEKRRLKEKKFFENLYKQAQHS